MDGAEFETFWAAFPRKEAKKDAMKAWAQMTAEQKFAAVQSIPIHVQFWTLSGRSRNYIPMPATWLRGERWTDELAMPEPIEDNDWMKSAAGIERMAAKVGIQARPGENHFDLKARILARKAA